MKATFEGKMHELRRFTDSLPNINHSPDCLVKITVEFEGNILPAAVVQNAPQIHHKTRRHAQLNPAKAYWARMTPQQRSDEMARRRTKGLGRKPKNHR